jgi:UDP-glucose 4-epimerase
MHVLVTGGAGFIGSTIARRFLAGGHTVRILDSLVTGLRQNVPSEAEFIEGDIRNPETLQTVCDGIDVVLHQAAMVSVVQSAADPAGCFDVNVVGTQRVLAAAVSAGAKRVVLASSSAVYGNRPVQPKREDSPLDPLSPYAESKLANEGDARYQSVFNGLETVCFRYFNVFGPNQRADSPYSGVISILVKALLERQTFTIFGTGEQTRDFVFVEDVAGAVYTAATRPGIRHEVLNVGRGQPVSLLELIELAAAITGETPRLAFATARPDDVKHSQADVTRLAERLGYRARTPVSVGLARTIGWMQESQVLTM